MFTIEKLSKILSVLDVEYKESKKEEFKNNIDILDEKIEDECEFTIKIPSTSPFYSLDFIEELEKRTTGKWTECQILIVYIPKTSIMKRYYYNFNTDKEKETFDYKIVSDRAEYVRKEFEISNKIAFEYNYVKDKDLRGDPGKEKKYKYYNCLFKNNPIRFTINYKKKSTWFNVELEFEKENKEKAINDFAELMFYIINQDTDSIMEKITEK